MSRNDCDWIFGFGMMVAGLIGLGYGLGVHCKMKKLCEKLDTTIEDLSIFRRKSLTRLWKELLKGGLVML